MPKTVLKIRLISSGDQKKIKRDSAPQKNIPELRAESIESIAQVLSKRNLKLLRFINKFEPKSLTELKEKTGEEISSISRALKEMSKFGLLEITGDEKDGKPLIKASKLIIEISILGKNPSRALKYEPSKGRQIDEKLLPIGILPFGVNDNYAIKVARGEVVPKNNDPSIWIDSIESLARMLSEENQDLLRMIMGKNRYELSELESISGRDKNILRRTFKGMRRYGLVGIEKHDKGERPVFNATGFRIEMWLVDPNPVKRKFFDNHTHVALVLPEVKEDEVEDPFEDLRNDHLEKLAKVLNIKTIDEDDAKRIENEINQYLHNKTVHANNQKAKKLRKSRKDILKGLKNYSEKLDTFCREYLHIVLPELTEVDPEAGRLITGDLEPVALLHETASKALDNFNRSDRHKPRKALRHMILGLIIIFEKLTKRKATMPTGYLVETEPKLRYEFDNDVFRFIDEVLKISGQPEKNTVLGRQIIEAFETERS
jgi:predicted transcriptional regulator